MYEENGNETTITCDKCKTKETVKTENAGEQLYKKGWAFNNGRKYKQLCSNCIPAKYKKSWNKHLNH